MCPAGRHEAWYRGKGLRGVGLAIVVSLAPGLVHGQWVEAPGKGWISVEAYHHDTRDRFDSNGDRNPIAVNGHAVSTAVFATGAVGLIPNWDLWARASLNFLSFDDAGRERSENGPGDVNLWLRVAPLKYLGVDFLFALRGGVKLPAGAAPIDAEIIPLSEGQTDWEIMAEVGYSFWPRTVYVNGWLGYRYRLAHKETRRNPGNETFFLAQVGGALGSVQYKLVVEGWDGGVPILEGIRVTTDQRNYLQVTPSLWYETGFGGFELGWRVPIEGRNLPDGGALVIGYFTRFGF